MICEKIKLPMFANTVCNESGMDCFEFCKDKTHFTNFPYNITYNFNSRGFRDAEWPEDLLELSKCIWCIGESFTTGLGSPIDHTWPVVLQEKSKQRTINVSMDGGSNEWLSQTAEQILKEVCPDRMIVCWTYPERRIDRSNEGYKHIDKEFLKSYSQIKCESWPSIKSIMEFNYLDANIRKEVLCDHNLHLKELLTISDNFTIIDVFVPDNLQRLQSTNQTSEEDMHNLLQCIQNVESFRTTQVIHSFVPNFCRQDLRSNYHSEISKLIKNPIYIEQLDFARDKHHFDIKTSKNFCKKILEFF